MMNIDKIINTRDEFYLDENFKNGISKFEAFLTICKGVRVKVLAIINRNNGTTTIAGLEYPEMHVTRVLNKYGYSTYLYDIAIKDTGIDNFSVTSHCHKDDKFDPVIGLNNAKRKYLNVVHRYLLIQLDNMDKFFSKILSDFEREINRYEPKPIDRGE